MSALVFPCHRCGQSRRITLTGALPRCSACADDTAPPPELRKTIAAARSAALNLPFRAAQVQAFEAMEVVLEDRAARGRWRTLAFVLALPGVTGMLLFPLAIADHNRGDTVCAVAFALPFLLHLLFGWRWRRVRLARSKEFRAELEVRPEQLVPLVCHSCGAPLESDSLDETVVTCGHCNGENVMDGRTAAERARQELALFASIEAGLRAKAIARIERDALRTKVGLYGPLTLAVVVAIVFMHFV